MGGDGGSIPGRADMVKTSGYRFVRNLGGMGYLPNTQVRESTDKYSRLEDRSLKLTTCALTKEPLYKPIVICKTGQLYNKEAILEFLLKIKNIQIPDNVTHIKSLKNIRELDVNINPTNHHMVCSLSGKELEGGIESIALWSCGCVMAYKAFCELTSFNMKENCANESILYNCPLCEKKFNASDIVHLVPDSDQIQKIQIRLLQNTKIKSHLGK